MAQTAESVTPVAGLVQGLDRKGLRSAIQHNCASSAGIWYGRDQLPRGRLPVRRNLRRVLISPRPSALQLQLYFQSMRVSTGSNVELFVMNPNGTGLQQLTTSAGEDSGPRVR